MQASTVLLVNDLQNDFCHHEGIFYKQGLSSAALQSILPQVIDTILFCSKIKIPIIATQVTILNNLKGEAIGLKHLKKLHPFLEKEGLREGTWGHDLLEDIPIINFKIRKWGVLTFFQTELDHYLSSLNCKELVLIGFTTNGSVETTAREAFGRGYKITTLSDCVASYSNSLHQSSLINLMNIGKVLSTKEWQGLYEKIVQKETVK